MIVKHLKLMYSLHSSEQAGSMMFWPSLQLGTDLPELTSWQSKVESKASMSHNQNRQHVLICSSCPHDLIESGWQLSAETTLSDQMSKANPEKRA